MLLPFVIKPEGFQFCISLLPLAWVGPDRQLGSIPCFSDSISRVSQLTSAILWLRVSATSVAGLMDGMGEGMGQGLEEGLQRAIKAQALHAWCW